MKKIAFYVLAFVLMASAAPAFAADDKKDAPPVKPWAIRCEKDPVTKKDEGPKRGRCEMYQRLTVRKSNQRVLEAAIGFPKDKKNARGIIIAPLGILLQNGLQMKVDDGAPFKFQARYCDKGGCYGYIDLTDSLLDTMRKGKKLVITFVAVNKKTVNVELTLETFAEALKEIS